MLSIDATRILLGTLLLLLGRRLFWLFVGAVGFVAGINLAGQLHLDLSEDAVIAFSLILGLVAAVLAIALRRAALAVAGFLAGGYLLTQFMAAAVLPTEAASANHLAPWVIFAVGGLVGAVLMNVVFNWTLIVLSAMGGAYLICMCVHGLNGQLLTALYTTLSILGILAQAGFLRRRGAAS